MDGVVVRRVMLADNSCLFNSVAYLAENSRDKGTYLRLLIAKTVAADPVTFNATFLEKTNEEYVKWITHKDSWGGAIEIAILADHLKVQVAVFDIRTQRCDVYAQDKPYSQLIMLLYDGIHYDALAISPFPDAPEEFDQTIVNVSDLKAVTELAQPLIAKLCKDGQYTDTASFTLRCGICRKGLTGQNEAVEHAKATGHTNFQEF